MDSYKFTTKDEQVRLLKVKDIVVNIDSNDFHNNSKLVGYAQYIIKSPKLKYDVTIYDGDKEYIHKNVKLKNILELDTNVKSVIPLFMFENANYGLLKCEAIAAPSGTLKVKLIGFLYDFKE